MGIWFVCVLVVFAFTREIAGSKNLYALADVSDETIMFIPTETNGFAISSLSADYFELNTEGLVDADIVMDQLSGRSWRGRPVITGSLTSGDPIIVSGKPGWTEVGINVHWTDSNLIRVEFKSEGQRFRLRVVEEGNWMFDPIDSAERAMVEVILDQWPPELPSTKCFPGVIFRFPKNMVRGLKVYLLLIERFRSLFVGPGMCGPKRSCKDRSNNWWLNRSWLVRRGVTSLC